MSSFWIWFSCILLGLIVLVVYILYRIGKKVKEREKMFMDMMDEQKVKKRLSDMQKKYGNKSTPKVPSIENGKNK